jgi:membrane protein required for colicin V production
LLFDLFVPGLILLAAVLGAWKGFAWQLAHVLSIVAGIGLGWPLSDELAPLLGLAAPVDRWAAFGILYVLLSLVVHLVALGFRRSLERRRLASWDHHLGFLAGAAKGFALCLLATIVTRAGSEESAGALRSSRVGRFMEEAAGVVAPALPEGVRALLQREPEV